MCFKGVSSHLAVGVRVQHTDRGLGRVKDHVVHKLLHHIRISHVLHQLKPLLTWLQVSENQTFASHIDVELNVLRPSCELSNLLVGFWRALTELTVGTWLSSWLMMSWVMSSFQVRPAGATETSASSSPPPPHLRKTCKTHPAPSDL